MATWWWLYSILLDVANDRGYSTRENVIRGVRTLAQYLENTTGHVPKWLDEFK